MSSTRLKLFSDDVAAALALQAHERGWSLLDIVDKADVELSNAARLIRDQKLLDPEQAITTGLLMEAVGLTLDRVEELKGFLRRSNTHHEKHQAVAFLACLFIIKGEVSPHLKPLLIDRCTETLQQRDASTARRAARTGPPRTLRDVAHIYRQLCETAQPA
ncbi:MAG: hypothetical protein QM783_03045 [Phycisphaerales bacterium]